MTVMKVLLSKSIILINIILFYPQFIDLARWLKSYLSGRQQYTSVAWPSDNLPECFESCHHTITCGVPQGSILGPLLFAMYINDLPRALGHDVGVVLFADDTTLAFSDTCTEALAKKTQTGVLKLLNWLKPINLP